MPDIDTKFLTVVRAAIAARDIQKKTLARRCKLSRPYFSEMIHGDRIMPDSVRDRLIAELQIEELWAKLSASASG